MKKSIVRPFQILLLLGLVVTLCLLLYGRYKLTRLVAGGLGDQFPTRLYAAPSSLLPGTTVPAELLLMAELSGRHKIEREPAAYSEFPSPLIQAIVAVEDRRFFEHHGLDGRSLARASWVNLKAGRALQGGSTITQQVARNLFLVPRKALWRKASEAILALYLETLYSKEEILTLYLNQVYWGQRGPWSICGAKAAARFYFNKTLPELTVGESALLAGLLRSPFRYNPFRHPRAALERRNFVLKLMRQQGRLSEAPHRAAISEPLRLNASPSPPPHAGAADYFVAEATQQLVEKYSDDVVFRHGLTVFTTLDPRLQDIAQKEVSKLSKQAALVSLDPATGAVRALVGGKSFAKSQFNRATQAKRQPGSAFKPFVYGAALHKPAPDGKVFTPASLILDEPRDYPTPTGPWRPKNYDGVYHSTVTFRQAIAFSLNAATVNLAHEVGPRKIAAYARSLGIQSPLKDEELGLALGASDVTLLELTAAYAPFANGGKRIEPYLVQRIQNVRGEVLEEHTPKEETAITPGEAFLVTSVLQSVVQEGTAKSLKSLGVSFPVAGKTGTSSDFRDAWFIGYTPHLLTGVWVGEDRPRSLQGTGAGLALPIWASVMRQALEGLPTEEFMAPEDVVSIKIDPTTGLRAVSGCPMKIKDFFLKGTEPADFCNQHPGGVKGWLHRLFGQWRSSR